MTLPKSPVCIQVLVTDPDGLVTFMEGLYFDYAAATHVPGPVNCPLVAEPGVEFSCSFAVAGGNAFGDMLPSIYEALWNDLSTTLPINTESGGTGTYRSTHAPVYAGTMSDRPRPTPVFCPSYCT